jgi:hypothetical protein
MGHHLRHHSGMGRSHRACGWLLALVLGGCGESFKRADGGAAGADDGGAGGAGSGAGSPTAGEGGRASAGTSSSGGKGGAPLGGASMGGATGGVTMGGTSPGGGGAAGSTTTSGAECEVAEDCMLIDDCCSCSAAPKSDEITACGAVCIQSACSARGVPGVTAKCVAKRCVLDLSCNALEVTCKAAQPSCGSGQVPSVVEGCWGPCIHATECREVADCNACGAGSSCVTQSLMMPSVHCVSVSAACEAAPSCECVDACSQACSDEGGKIDCFCPAC